MGVLSAAEPELTGQESEWLPWALRARAGREFDFTSTDRGIYVDKIPRGARLRIYQGLERYLPPHREPLARVPARLIAGRRFRIDVPTLEAFGGKSPKGYSVHIVTESGSVAVALRLYEGDTYRAPWLFRALARLSKKRPDGDS